MEGYLIKDLERLSGIKAHTIRIWEKRYDLFNPERDNANIRYYTDDDLKKILNISFLYNSGQKISSLAKLSKKDLAEKVRLVKEYNTEAESSVNSLVMAMIDFNEEAFDRVLSKAIIRLGLKQTFLKVLLPVLDRIGIMWQTDSISPAQEHFASNLIRKKIFVASDNQVINKPGTEIDAILFLPEHEMHEMSLLFMNYYLRHKNLKCIYLGQSVPIELIKEMTNKFQPKLLVTAFVSSFTDEQANNVLDVLNVLKKKSEVLFLGSNMKNVIGEEHKKDYLFVSNENELDEFEKLIDNLT